MIYTLTLNPALDYVVFLDSFKTGEINRSVNESIYFGGKGINVSLILNKLGVKSVVTGFTAGFTGEALEKGIACENITSDFVRLKTGMTRINIKIRDGNETDINALGPTPQKEELQKLFNKLEKLKADDFLVISGSVPNTLPKDIYEQILKKTKGVKFAVDAEGELLLNTLKYNPFLIKPNESELSEIFSVNIDNPDIALEYAAKLQKMGAENVLVSLGNKGAVLLDKKGKSYFAAAHKGKAVNTVGAGDSMLAGFIAGYFKNESLEYALKLGTAAGSATAFSKGLATKEDIFNLMEI